MLHVMIFGETRVVDGERVLGPRQLGGIKPRQVLEVLALHGGHPVTKDRLVEHLWADAAPGTATATLEAYVSVLRGRLQPGVPARSSAVRTTNGGYLLDPDCAQVDLLEFRSLLAAPREAPADQARPLLRRALALTESDLLESEPYCAWASHARDGIVTEIVSACTEAGIRALDEQAWDDAIALARRALGMDPLAEACGRVLVEGLWRAGRKSEALRAYEQLRTTLADELGTDPARATQELYLRVLRDLRPHEVTAVVTPRRESDGPATSEDELLERLWCVVLAAVGGSGRIRREQADSIVARVTADLALA